MRICISIASYRHYRQALGIEKALKEIASGKYYEADTERLFELAKKSRYPGIFSELAESFGMMMVKVEHREFLMK